MENLFPLMLFPTGGLSSSVVTTVWVGVCVVVFLNLKFGTMLSGLVVPGYLIPLLLVRPESAFVILAEGLATYYVARLFVEWLPVNIGYAEMFGRDRFFVLIIFSVLVRVLFDVVLLPYLENYAVDFGFSFEFQSNLHSFGLILVALIANQFWNSGFRLGIQTIVLYLGISYLLVRYGLMMLTNFNISTLAYMYEDMASSILASPKAYIILLSSAFIASRMNIRYGWEYSGILIPSLLALQWFQPGKLFATFVEALVVFLGARLLLCLPALRHTNIEGARELLFFFSISFVYKILLGYMLLWFLPSVKITDFYGFGYLLSTLMAIKMHQKDIAIMFVRMSVQTSATGVVLASIIGFALTLLPHTTMLRPESGVSTTVANLEEEEELFDFLLKKQAISFSSDSRDLFEAPNVQEMEQARSAFLTVDEYLKTGEKAALTFAHQQFQALEMELYTVNSEFIVVEDRRPERGWGVYVFSLISPGQLILEVPAALDEPRALEAAIWMFLQNEASGLAFSGVRRGRSVDGASDTLANAATIFQLFHQQFGKKNTLQIRALSSSTIRPLFGLRENDIETLAELPSSVWVKRSLPEALDLVNLRSRLGEFELNWQASSVVNRQREASTEGFAELFLSASGMKAWIAEGFRAPIESLREELKIDGYLQSWLYSHTALIATKGNGGFTPPDLGALVYWDQLILSPLFQWLHKSMTAEVDAAMLDDLSRLSRLCEIYGYRIRLYEQGDGNKFILLAPSDSQQFEYRWGVYVFRVGQVKPAIVSVPRPMFEVNTFEFGSTFFEGLDAAVLAIAGSHPFANADGSSDHLARKNKQTLFNLVHQVWQRESNWEYPAVYLVRAMAEGGGQDLFIAPFHSLIQTGIPHYLDQYLGLLGLQYEMVAGKHATLGYESQANVLSDYLRLKEGAELYSIWVAPSVRRRFVSPEDYHRQTLTFDALGLRTFYAPLSTSLAFSGLPPKRELDTERLKKPLSAFVSGRNIQQLYDLVVEVGADNISRIIDEQSQQCFLLLRGSDGSPQLVMNLNPSQSGSVLWQGTESALLKQYVDGRYTFLEWREF